MPELPEQRSPTFDAERLAAVSGSGLHADPAVQLDRLTSLAAEIAGCPVSLVSVVGAEGQYFTSQHGLTGDIARSRATPLSHSVCRTVVDRGVPLIIDDLGLDPEFHDHPARLDLGVEAYCGVPFRDPAGNVIGSLCLIDSEPRQWSAANVTLLQRLSVFVTETIAVHQSYVHLVVDAQQRLLPSTIAQPARGRLRGTYRAVPGTAAIGGDFFDVRDRPDGSIDIVVGDVVGHGMASAGAAGQLRACLVALLGQSDLGPAQVVERTSAIVDQLPGCMCAALIVARIDASGRSVRWARAGAQPPLATGGRRTLDLSLGANPPLGAVDNICIREVEHNVTPGERLVFFTDGLVERRHEQASAGLERLWQLAGTVDDIDALVDAACPAGQQFDDIVVVLWDT